MPSSPKRSPWCWIFTLPVVLAAAGMGLPATAAAQGKTKADLPPYHSPQPIPEPKLFAGSEVSTVDYESGTAFAPGGHTLYYVKSTPDFRYHTILVTHYQAGRWSIPSTAPFSGKYSDAEPFVTPDGSKLYYRSDRPLDDFIGAEPRNHSDLWVVEWVGDSAWSEPRNLGNAVNGPSNEFSPSVAADGTIYFASDRPGGHGGIDLYRCRLVDGTYQAAENLGDSLNTAGDERDPWISPDQRTLIFSASARPGGHGGADLYVATATGGGWSRPRNLGDAINSPRDEYLPAVSPDGEYFFWTSCRSFADQPFERAWQYPELLNRIRRTGNGLGDLYQIDLAALGLGK